MKTCRDCKLELPATSEYFYKEPLNRDKLRNNCKSCHNAKCNDWNRANPERNKESLRTWRKANPHRVRELNRKKDAKKIGVRHQDWTEKELFERYGTNCYICNDAIDFTAPRKGPGSDWSSWPDHVIPTSRGGDNTIGNVRPCHAKCNRNKANKTYYEYMEHLKCLT